MANPETTSHLDDEKPQLKVERKEVKRKPNNIEWQNDEVKNIESKNADWELLYQMILLDLREAFPGIPEDLSDKRITIVKWNHVIKIIKYDHIDIYDGKGTTNGGIGFSIDKQEDWTYRCTKSYWIKVIGKPNAVELHRDDIEQAEFQNAMSEFTNNPDSCRISIREIGE